MKLDLDFVITVDRSMMTNHHGKEFIGFMTTGPPIILPEKIWNWICMPKMQVDEYGRPKEAPYGLRKIEATLQNAGFKAAIIDPDYIDRYVGDIKAILIGHHDYFALGPPSSEWWIITKREPVNARTFRRFMESKAMKKARKKGVKTVVGGPAAWQWLWKPDLIDLWKINCIIDGEAERVILDVADRILNNEPIPLYIFVGPDETPSIDEIPVIKGASVNGLIEVMRGCPRRCKFCSVTLRPLRYIPLDKIEKEIKVNLEHGVNGVILHSEDVLLYGADGIYIREKPVIKLHEVALKYVKSIAWSHASLAAVKYAQDKYKLITKIMEMVYNIQDYMGVEVGIETGSPELAEKIMPAKALPYKAKEWPDVVEDAFAIMHENNIIPAATLIIGLPGETEDDIIKTIELIERLRPYRSLIITMYFVPMGLFKNKDWYKEEKIEGVYKELGLLCLKHSLYWAEDILTNYYIRGKKQILVKALLKLLIKGIKTSMRRHGYDIEFEETEKVKSHTLYDIVKRVVQHI